MFDYVNQISDFINKGFVPAEPELANVKYTSKELLHFLFETFPNGCINEYELNELLVNLKFKRSLHSVEYEVLVENEEGKEVSEKRYNLKNVWCMYTDLIP